MYHQNQINHDQHQLHHHHFNNQFNLINNQSPIICSPSLIRQPTTLESLTSTFQSFSLPNFPSPFRQASNSNLPHYPSSDPFFWSKSPNSRNTQLLPSLPPPTPSNPLSGLDSPHDSDRIIFSTWVHLNNHRHLLLINDIGIALWDTEDLEALLLACWIRWDHLTIVSPTCKNPSPIDSLDHIVTPSSHNLLHNFEPISAAVLPSLNSSLAPVFVLLFNSLLEGSLKLITVAADSGHISNVIDLAGIGVQLGINRNIIVVATKSPLALHLFSWSQTVGSTQLSLVRLPFSPILDLASRPKTGDPVFHLGRTRLLVYASSKPPNEREPPIATGPGFSFLVPSHGPHSPSTAEVSRENRESSFALNPGLSAAQNTSPVGTSSTSWRNSVAPNLDAIDETARKLGGGLLTGAKYLSSWGHNLWNPNMDKINSPRQTFHHSPRNDVGIGFSQSAPLPHKMSAARPASHSRYEDSHGNSHGNVHIIDLFGDNFSNQNAHNHPYSICHFKISSEPLTFLSLNPSSNLLLTSSIEGHSFHIFELRPASRVGKSHMNAFRLDNFDSRKETTVWHRYKLTRGFTSAQVTDVVWRWDSKIVSVLTEHGTNHLFAIHPGGGAAGLDAVDVSGSLRATDDPLSSIFGSRVHNPRTPQSLSVTVSAFDKIKHKPLRHNPSLVPSDKTSSTAAFGSTGYFDHFPLEHENSANPSPFRHTCLIFMQPKLEHFPNGSRDDKQHVLPESHQRLPSVLLYDPSTNSVTLYNFETKKKLLNSVTGGVSSGFAKNTTNVGTDLDIKQHTHSEAKSQTSSSPSGLSQLMQQNKHTGIRGKGQDLHTHSSNVFIHSFAPVVWSLGTFHDPVMINTNRFYGCASSESPSNSLNFIPHSIVNSQNWTSFAELDTFSHSPRILPRSIYISHQFDFYNFTPTRKSTFNSFSNPTYQSSNDNPSFIEQLLRADFDHMKKKKIVVKREVQIQPGDLGTQQDSIDLFALSTVEINDNFVNPHFNETRSKKLIGITTYNQMYAEPIRSAVEAVLDPSLASSKSPPNAISTARPVDKVSHGAHQNPLISFKKSLANNVAPVVGVVNERMRKELGKIGSSSAIGEAGRRRISGAGYWNGISESLGQRLNWKSEVYDGSAYVSEGITSLSFEDDQDEAIRIDRSLFDAQGPSSSSMNSFTSSNSIANANSDELGLESNSRSGRSIMDEDVTEEVPETWDGWTFEDDLEIKSQSEPKDRSPLSSEIRRVGSSQQPGQDHQGYKKEEGWNSSMIHSILTANPSAGLATQLQEIELRRDDHQQSDDRPDSKTYDNPKTLEFLSRLQVQENKSESDPNSGSRSSSALSTSTSASTSGQDSSSSKKTKEFQIDHSPKALIVQKSSPSGISKKSKSNRASPNYKKR